MSERRVVLTCAADITPRRRTPDWGGWLLRRETRELALPVHRSLIDFGDDAYAVDLDDCRTSAQVLDWICQVASKSWATDEIVAGLVRALSDVLDPQSNLCSGGQGKALSAAALRRLVGRW